MSPLDPLSSRLDRRRVIAGAASIVGAAAIGAPAALAQSANTETREFLNPYDSPQLWSDFPANVDPGRFAPLQRLRSGQMPIALICPDAGVDAAIEVSEIVDNRMADPTGPWVVAWYPTTSGPGGEDNIVMSGHVDYWDVGPAVFWSIRDLPQGTLFTVITDRNESYVYRVEWIQEFQASGLDQATMSEISGRKDSETLTLITCGGEFDQAKGEYLSRMVVRCVPAI
jgi:hypothetical protein